MRMQFSRKQPFHQQLRRNSNGIFSAVSVSTHSKDGSNNRVSCTTLRSVSQITAHGSILYN